MSLPQTGITMSAVHCALAVITPLSSCTLSDLVQVNSINKWSACKPIKHTGNSLADTYSGLTGVMATSNFGFDFDNDYCADANAALSKAATSTTLWSYVKWTPSASYPARLGDFRGYNHAAVCPFTQMDFSYTPVPGVENTTHVPTFGFAEYINTNAEIYPKDMSAPIGSGNYEIIYRKKGTNSATVAATSALTATTIQTGRLSGTTSNTGTFEVCLAVHRSGGDGEYYPLPYTYRTFEVRNQTKEEYAGVYITNLCYLNAQSTTSKIHYSVKFKVTNITNSAVTIYAGCEIKGSDTTKDSIWRCMIPSTPTSSTPSWTIPSGSSITLYGAGDNDWYLTTTDPGELDNEESVSYYGSPITATCYVRNSLYGDVTVDSAKTVYGS